MLSEENGVGAWEKIWACTYMEGERERDPRKFSLRSRVFLPLFLVFAVVAAQEGGKGGKGGRPDVFLLFFSVCLQTLLAQRGIEFTEQNKLFQPNNDDFICGM